MKQSNNLFEQILNVWENKKVSPAPSTLKEKILKQLPYVRQDIKIVPISYYYRAGIAAALLIFINLFAISSWSAKNNERMFQKEFYKEYIGNDVNIF